MDFRSRTKQPIFRPAIAAPTADARGTALARVVMPLVIGVLLSAAGCHPIDYYAASLQNPVPLEMEPPRELSMVSLPAYQVEPPDVIYVDIPTLVVRPPYRIEPYDVLQINTVGTLRDVPLRGIYRVETDGTMDLGMPYGAVRLAGLTIEEAESQIIHTLQFTLKNVEVSLSLYRSATAEQLSGKYTIAPDGTINLGRFGEVHVAGKTVMDTKKAIEEHLSHYFDSLQAAVEVRGYNSKSYYVVWDTIAEQGKMWRFPITGNETVLDAMSLAPKYTRMSAKTVFVARPAPGGSNAVQVLPVDWEAVSRGGSTATNYQLMPGDRVYVVDDAVLTAGLVINNIASPISRLMSVVNLGTTTTRSWQTLGRSYNSRR